MKQREMTKQQLTRLFIVIAAMAAIVFVPYWVGIVSSATFAPIKPGAVPTAIAFWAMGIVSLTIMILPMVVIATISYLAYNYFMYIKKGKWG